LISEGEKEEIYRPHPIEENTDNISSPMDLKIPIKNIAIQMINRDNGDIMQEFLSSGGGGISPVDCFNFPTLDNNPKWQYSQISKEDSNYKIVTAVTFPKRRESLGKLEKNSSYYRHHLNDSRFYFVISIKVPIECDIKSFPKKWYNAFYAQILLPQLENFFSSEAGKKDTRLGSLPPFELMFCGRNSLDISKLV